MDEQIPKGHVLEVPRGYVRGTGVIRDKDGNVKGEFTFEGPATPEQVKEVFDRDV